MRLPRSTERLSFRSMQHKDHRLLKNIFQDKDVMRYYSALKSEKEIDEWIHWNKSHYLSYGVGMWIVEDRQNQRFIGQCGLVPEKIEGSVSIELGYLFTPENWGYGYASEAAATVRNFAFYSLDISMLISIIDPENTPSIKVAENIGMTYQRSVKRWNRSFSLYATVRS
ncbi:GNAT family N-acetyltransferase [Marinococcus luteus]|nr:GNAT family N-acetyltransferase [Marinococcus luteus]